MDAYDAWKLATPPYCEGEDPVADCPHCGGDVYQTDECFGVCDVCKNEVAL